MKVLIIPEDPLNDQYILKPIVERIFKDLGKPARVEVLQDPRLRSVNQALDRKQVADIVDDNRMVDLFLLMVDRDCDREGNSAKAKAREEEHACKLLACLAVEEVEVWMLALHRTDQRFKPWNSVRKECDPKEVYAQPFLEEEGWDAEVGGGYKRGMRELSAGWKGLLKACPEINDLKARVAAKLAVPGS
ncbi:MAG: hypothetical protein AB1758_23485 [Candidatus Eremiobacterota bacterium]